MKKTILSLLVAVGLIGSVSAQLVAEWKLDGNANDSIGSANGNATGVTWVTSNFNGYNRTVASFDGSSYIQVPHSTGIDLGNNFTLSAWVNVTGFPNTHDNNQYPIFDAGGQPMVSESSYSLVVQPVGIYFSMSGASDYPINSQVYNYSGTGSSISLNYWHNIIVTYNGNTVNSYLDGNVLNGSFYHNATNISPCPNFSYLRIGQSHGGDPNFQGIMSDLQFYNTTLTPQQVSQLYALQSVPEPSTYALLCLGIIGTLLAIRRRHLC
jgi:hypothetical protein